MRRLSALLFVTVLSLSAIVLSAPLLAQSRLAQSKNDEFDAAATNLIRNVTVDCNTMEHDPNTQGPRIFAPINSADDSSGWLEYDSRAAWKRAGSPQPVALVWYHQSRIFRVAITPNETSNPLVYADYCYREDGTLARLRPVPSVQRKCEPNRNQCTWVLREVRFYPPEGPVLKTYGVDRLLIARNSGVFESLPAEHTVVTYVPMKWPEYLRVADLPFSGLLYARLR